MRGLAEFIMRGRWQALAVAVLGAGSLLFGWLSAAAVALVTLRKGLSEGTWLVFWALLPAFLAAWASGDIGGIVLLLGTYVVAVVLRTTVSLALALLVAAAVGLLSGAGLLLFSGEFLEQLVLLFEGFVAELANSLPAGEKAPALVTPTAPQVAGILAAGNAATIVLSLLLARYWQAALFNPGGFREEFHQLRLPLPATLFLVVLAGGVWVSEPVVSGWAMVLAVPVMFAGFALFHAWIARTGRGNGSVVIFYLLWLLIDPLKGLVLGVAVADAVMDFRRRWTLPPPDDGA